MTVEPRPESSTILIVDDQPSVRHFVGRALNKLQRFHHTLMAHTLMAMTSKRGIISHEPYNLCGNHVASAGKNQSATSIASWIST